MNTLELFSHISNILSMIAFLFVAYQFFLWRKQQRYSLELENILNMECLFEVYIESQMRLHAHFEKANKLCKESADKTKEERHNLDMHLKSEFQDLVLICTKEVTDNATSYSLARFRVIRLNFNIEKINELDAGWLSDRFNQFLQEKTSIEKSCGEISKIKEIAFKEFDKLRKLN